MSQQLRKSILCNIIFFFNNLKKIAKYAKLSRCGPPSPPSRARNSSCLTYRSYSHPQHPTENTGVAGDRSTETWERGEVTSPGWGSNGVSSAGKVGWCAGTAARHRALPPAVVAATAGPKLVWSQRHHVTFTVVCWLYTPLYEASRNAQVGQVNTNKHKHKWTIFLWSSSDDVNNYL